MKIEHAILGAERFTKDELREISLKLDERELEFREYAVRYARLLKHLVALRNPNLRTVAEIAAGLARAELQLDDDQRVCEIEPGENIQVPAAFPVSAPTIIESSFSSLKPAPA